MKSLKCSFPGSLHKVAHTTASHSSAQSWLRSAHVHHPSEEPRHLLTHGTSHCQYKSCSVNTALVRDWSWIQTATLSSDSIQPRCDIFQVRHKRTAWLVWLSITPPRGVCEWVCVSVGRIVVCRWSVMECDAGGHRKAKNRIRQGSTVWSLPVLSQ